MSYEESTSPSAEKTRRRTSGIGTIIRDTFTIVRGLGDSIRGNVNAAADGLGEGISGRREPPPRITDPDPSERRVSDKPRGSAAWQDVANKGTRDMKQERREARTLEGGRCRNRGKERGMRGR
ncbi:hypothetical protein BT69DRAFT_1017875 [Atractiella rhizophila]|nr:hypothetical protein BT69DRAFT_1017875 [Atractiella rhizophila]